MPLFKNCPICKIVQKRPRWRVKMLLVAALLIYFAFGLYHLTNFISSDEHFWLPNSGTERIEDYWKAIRRGDWKDTRVNDKPGVTLAYIPGLVYFFEDAKGQAVVDGKAKIFNPEKTREINFIYRLPVLIFNGLFALFFFWIIKKITADEWIALWSVILILLSPILLGISQIVNPDSLFWVFSVSAILTFFHFLQTGGKRFALLATLLFGLTMATKYVGIILIPFFLFMTAAFYLFAFDKRREEEGTFAGIVLKNSLFYWLIIFGGLAIFAILMPALIVKPKFFYEGTIGFPGMAPIFWLAMAANLGLIIDAFLLKSRVLIFILKKSKIVRRILPMAVQAILLFTFLLVLFNWMSRNSLIDLSGIPFDLKRGDLFEQISLFSRFIMEAVPMVFSVAPFILFLLFYLWASSFFKKEAPHALLVFIFSSFIIIFYLAAIKQGLLLTVRYSIMLYPLVMVLSAISLRQLFAAPEDGEMTAKKDWPRMIISFLTASILVFQGLSLYFQSLSKTEQDNIYISYHRPGEYAFAIAILLAIYAAYRIIRIALRAKQVRHANPIHITLAIIILSATTLWLCKPFYFNYTNDLLPKRYLISAAWGYGGYEAAQYVNSLPDAKNLTVWTDMYGFCEFFVGRCVHASKINTDKYKIDYYYMTLKGSISPRFPHPMESKPVWELRIDGRQKNFVKILKALPLDPSVSGEAEADNNNEDDTDTIENEE